MGSSEYLIQTERGQDDTLSQGLIVVQIFIHIWGLNKNQDYL